MLSSSEKAWPLGEQLKAQINPRLLLQLPCDLPEVRVQRGGAGGLGSQGMELPIVKMKGVVDEAEYMGGCRKAVGE